MYREATVVDNDIFSRTVARPWRRAAREVFAPDLTDRASDLGVQAAAEVLQSQGCPELPDILAIVARLRDLDRRPSVVDVLDQLDDVERRHMHAISRISCNVIRRWSQIADTAVLAELNDTLVVAEIVTELVTSRVSPAAILAQLQRTEGWSAAGIEERRNEFRVQLRSSARLTKLATQLLSDPTGGLVTRPRIPRPKADQRELVESFALTAI